MRFFRSLLIPLSFSLQAASPPPEVDQALRARINDFYQLQTDHQYRRAEAFIAEDTKDFYYEARKPDIKSFSIDKIEYADDFQTAVATIRGKVEVVYPRMPPMLIESASPSHWKIENGKWCWFMDEESRSATPFGKSALSQPGQPATDPAALFQNATAGAVKGVVQPDRQQIDLDPAHPAPQVIMFKNILPGPVVLRLATGSPALKVEIEKPDLGATESTRVTISAVEGANERPAQITFNVQPMNQTIPITIAWAAAK